MDSISLNKRLATFNNWPHSFSSCSPDRLAHAGFHYTQDEDAVQCNNCGVRIGNLQPEDDPITEHQKLSPNCQFLVKLTGIKPNKTHHHRCIEDDSGPFGFKYTLPATSPTGPRYPWLVSKEDRLKTFKHWPQSMKQKPIELVEAEFFYTVVGDLTICFYCGVPCKSWQEEDVPWEEHANLSPDCDYLQKSRLLRYTKDNDKNRK